MVPACSNELPATFDDDAGDAGVDATPPVLDPSQFDCTSLMRPPLPRRATSAPECLRDPSCKTRVVSSHRGAGGQLGRIAPEDSLAAYRAGIALGVDFVETDPRPTRDGVLVNIHDATLDRTTSGIGEVATKSLAEIQALALRTFDLRGDFKCERVPTLRELLDTCRERAMVLVDANKTDRVDLLVADIQAAGSLDWAVFDTTDLGKIDRALAIEPRLMIMPRIHDETKGQAVIDRYRTQHMPVFIEIGTEVFPKFVDAVHLAGTRVLVDSFVVDFSVRGGASRQQYVDDLYEKGADAVQTDLPDEVLAAIGRR